MQKESKEQLPDANKPPSDYKPSEDEDNLKERNDSVLDMAMTASEKQMTPLDSTLTQTVKVVAESAIKEDAKIEAFAS